MGIFICRFCGEEAERGRFEGARKHCLKTECIEKNKECVKQARARTQKKHNAKYLKMKRKKEKKVRVCNKCGGDPWPNHFNCPTCLSNINVSDEMVGVAW